MTRRTNSKHSVQLSFIYILHTLPFILHLEAITVPSLCFMLQGEGPAISETNRWLPYEQVGGNSGKEEFPLNRKRSLPSTVAGGGGRVQLKEMRKKEEHWETRSIAMHLSAWPSCLVAESLWLLKLRGVAQHFCPDIYVWPLYDCHATLSTKFRNFLCPDSSTHLCRF